MASTTAADRAKIRYHLARGRDEIEIACKTQLSLFAVRSEIVRCGSVAVRGGADGLHGKGGDAAVDRGGVLPSDARGPATERAEGESRASADMPGPAMATMSPGRRRAGRAATSAPSEEGFPVEPPGSAQSGEEPAPGGAVGSSPGAYQPNLAAFRLMDRHEAIVAAASQIGSSALLEAIAARDRVASGSHRAGDFSALSRLCRQVPLLADLLSDLPRGAGSAIGEVLASVTLRD